MGYDRNKVIQIAANEVGYLEKSKSAYTTNAGILYQKTAGAGYDNYTKYGYEMHQIYPSVMDFPAAWCDAFVDWAFYKAYGLATAKSLLGGNFDDYTVASAKMYKKHSALDNTPEVGSQIFFSKTKTVDGIYHTGLVVEVSSDGKTVTTVEGNTSAGTGVDANGGAVCKKVRTVSKYTLFGHPNYQDGYGTTKTEVTTTSKQTSVNYAAQITASTLRIRTGPGTNYSQLKLEGALQYLPKGMVVAIDKESNDWGELAGTKYWVSLSYVKKG